MLNVHLLGTMRASSDGREISLGGPKQETLLACLLVAQGSPVALDRLVVDLWGENLPRDPAHALQARISRLRAALPVDIDLLDRGYRIDPATVHIDSVRFEQLCRQADWLIAEGLLNQASECLNEGLELWRGPAFAGIDGSQELHGEAIRLEKLFEIALADRIDLDLSRGRHLDVIPKIHQLVAEDPLRERAWGQLMTATYLAGHPQEALDIFAQARETFSERLGVEPNGMLGQLHIMILEEKPAATLLRWPPVKPSEAETTPSEAISNFPVTVTSNQATTLARLVHTHGALLLTGAQGMGKTHLLRTVKTVIEKGAGSAPLLTASALSREIPLGVFAGVDGTDSDIHTSAASLIDFFVRRRSVTVILIDNVDQLDEISMFVVTQLIHISRVPAILTVRDLALAPPEIQALYDSGEITEATVEKLSDAEADELVVQMVRGSGLTPDTGPRFAVVADGNPLHLRELVTGSLRTGRLTQTEHGWSLQGLPAPTQRLSQLAGDQFDELDQAELEAVAKIAIAGEYPAEADEDLTELSRGSLLEFTEVGWLRLRRALDSEILRSRISVMRWQELTSEVVGTLRSDTASARPQAQQRACLLALGLPGPLDVAGTLALAEQALSAFDERLALRAAREVIDRDESNPDGSHMSRAHRIAGQAASILGEPQVATAHFAAARDLPVTAAERTALAIAHADYLGVRQLNAEAALDLINETRATVDSPVEVVELELAATRWATVAGLSADLPPQAHVPPEVATAGGLVTHALAAVISGPLSQAESAFIQLRRLPVDALNYVPGGTMLLELAEIMALSNTGDVLSTQRRLRERIDAQFRGAPERVGLSAYALGFSQLFSSDAEQAYQTATIAVQHLEWRDLAGLLPAARALLGAASCATGRIVESEAAFEAVPEIAESDPKVMMLHAWSAGKSAHAEGLVEEAALLLLDGAELMLTTRHTFFAGILAHCVTRLGVQVSEAAAIIEKASALAGGGLLALMVRHSRAVLVGDADRLRVVAREAEELGLMGTAADTWRLLGGFSDALGTTQADSEFAQEAVSRIRAEAPSLVLWSAAGKTPVL